jgi:adenine phosphoribosyltransferase
VTAVDLGSFVRDIPDFPTPGIVFKDITPVLAAPEALDAAVSGLAGFARDLEVELVVGAEARGFLLGPAIARDLGAGFILARKPGKLPRATVQAEYALEYGTDTLELHSDAVHGGSRVLVHDDLLATGGTASATCSLVEQLGGVVVGCAFLIELAFLRGRDRLQGRNVRSLLSYDSEYGTASPSPESASLVDALLDVPPTRPQRRGPRSTTSPGRVGVPVLRWRVTSTSR